VILAGSAPLAGGATVGSVKRHSRNRPNTPETLAARLPEDLKSFGLRTDMPARTAEIAEWINAQTPGMGADLVQPVMVEVGLTYLFSLRDQLTAVE
jgi:hypothetical protein